MAITPSDSFNLDLSLFGGLVTDIEGSDLPPGASPACQDMFFQAGNVATRPALSRELSTQLTGAPAVCSVSDFPLVKGGFLTSILDANGKLWTNNPVTNTNTNIDSVTPGVFFRACNAFDKQFMAFYSPTAFSAFSPNPFVGYDVPRYNNGTGTIQRVTIDAPGATPVFSNVSFPSFSLVTATTTGTKTITSVLGSGKQIIYIPGSGSTQRTREGGGSDFIPPSFITIWTTLIYTSSTTVPSSWLGLPVTITGLTGTNSSLANTTGIITAVSGSTFTIAANYSVQVNLTAQSGTATLAAFYLSRQNNIVNAYVGSSLPTGIQKGFFASILTSGGLQLNGPTWTITSATRDTTGLVTVTVSAQLVNLPVGTSIYFNNLSVSASGSVAVILNSPTVTWVSGNTFDQTWVGTAITINGIVYSISAASATTLTLSSNVSSASGTYAYTSSIVYIPAGFQTVTQVLSTTSTSTTFSFQSAVTIPFTISSGSAYQVWSPLGGTYGNAAQIIGITFDAINGYAIQWFQLGPDVQFTPGAAPLVSLVPQISPGIRNATIHFISQDGAETAPAVPIQITAGSGLSYLSAANIPIGPQGTASRAIDFTPLEGSSFYYIDPAFLPASGAQGPSITIGTLINDNTTTQAVLDFSDTQLTNGTQIDITGNNLFAQVVLAPCLGVIEYGERLFWWGEINNIKNLLNMGFDGGYNPPTGTVSVTNNSTSVSWVSGATFNVNWPANTVIVINGTLYKVASVGSSTALTLSAVFAGTTGTYAATVYSPLGQQPLGWTISGDGLGYLASPTQQDIGFSYVMPSGTNSQISQSAYQDANAAPIFAPNTTYIFRMKAVAASALTAGNFIATLSSASLGTIATATIAGTSIPTVAGWVQATFNGPLPSTVPSDLILEVALNGSTDQNITVDEFEIISTSQPVLNNQFRVSYALNPFGYDSVTGLIDIDTSESVTAAFQLRGILYLLTDESLFETEQNASSEPSGWTVNNFATHCGCSGPNAVDSLEDHAWWAGRYGARSFDGRTMPSKISQYIDSEWNINWAAQTTMWVCNDPVNRQLMIGVPQGTSATPNIILVMNYRLSDASENPPDPVHISMYSGKMLATDLAQKWCPWNITANCGALCTRNTATGLAKIVVVGGGNGLSLGSGTTYGEIYSFNFSKFTDDDYGQIHSSYTTYFLFNHEMEQNPLLASHRKLYTYLTIHATGVGKANVTPYVDALSNASPTLPLTTLSLTDPGFDLEWGLNVLGERCAFTIAPTPLSGQTDAYIKLTHLVLAGRQDRVTPIRGSVV